MKNICERLLLKIFSATVSMSMSHNKVIFTENEWTHLTQIRSICPGLFCKKSVLRNFAKFTGKHLCLNLFLNKVVGLKPATLLKKRLWRKCFPVNFTKFLRKLLSTEQLWWLLPPDFSLFRIQIYL